MAVGPVPGTAGQPRRVLGSAVGWPQPRDGSRLASARWRRQRRCHAPGGKLLDIKTNFDQPSMYPSKEINHLIARRPFFAFGMISPAAGSRAGPPGASFSFARGSARAGWTSASRSSRGTWYMWKSELRSSRRLIEIDLQVKEAAATLSPTRGSCVTSYRAGASVCLLNQAKMMLLHAKGPFPPAKWHLPPAPHVYGTGAGAPSTSPCVAAP